MSNRGSREPARLLILGVRRSDRRVPNLVEEVMVGPVDRVFNESPEMACASGVGFQSGLAVDGIKMSGVSCP